MIFPQLLCNSLFLYVFSSGKLPYTLDMEEAQRTGKTMSIAKTYPMLSGQVTGPIKDILPAKVIVENIVNEAIAVIKETSKLVSKL